MDSSKDLYTLDFDDLQDPNAYQQDSSGYLGENQKLITFAIPCYNSADYMDHCIQSILDGSRNHLDEIEIIIVDDGSTKDETPQKADDWQANYPGIIRAIHQENAGHGGAVNCGLENACGLYFKVVDSDDWLDETSLDLVLDLLAVFAQRENKIDLVLANYVYEHAERGTEVMNYTSSLPVGREFGWDEIGKFPISRYIIMHSVIYRTAVLHECKIKLPEHTFYVDNIFVYVPLPSVKTLFYLDVDLYRYFIGRDDQSVNESVMIGRIDQQLKITRIMIDSHNLSRDVENKKLRAYMENYLLMMMTISTVFTMLSDRPDWNEMRNGIWKYLEEKNPEIYPHMRKRFFGWGCNLQGKAGRKVIIGLYKIAQKLWKFN